ncbi:hypothetical protein YC2023_121337 [Brassica napus]|uniref:(rape) hypothetical protein n=1 Tax=Brassica napus TaxID=3708 RepID=A0A817AZT9_BRANA|nr:unnamed protein product [Brassica napus]
MCQRRHGKRLVEDESGFKLGVVTSLESVGPPPRSPLSHSVSLFLSVLNLFFALGQSWWPLAKETSRPLRRG